MKAWGVIVLLAAAAGTQVFAEVLVFPEDVQGRSSSRIVSGWEAQEGQIPWQLSVRMVNGSGSVFSCGGSIIHPEWGITAAHCTATRYTMVLRAGAVNLWRPELLFETTEYYNHPLYIDALQTVVQPNDIALLKFPRAIPFSDRIQPIRIQRDADKNRDYAGIRLEASGWGQTWTNGPSPENLQWVYLRAVSNLACWFSFGGSSIIVDSTICANYYNVTSQSTCQGDSGGPLVELEEDGRYTMVGVASFVALNGCHNGNFPAGFIRPGHYHDWYRQVTGINFDWEHGEPPSESSEETVESSEEAPEPETEESEEEAPEPDTEEEVAPEPETEESEEVAPEPDTEEEVAPEPETEESEEVAPEPETEEEIAPEPETEESEEVAPEPDTEEEVAPEPETEESEEEAPEPETEEEIAPEPETEESEEVAPEPDTEEEVAPEPETEESEEVAPEPESEEAAPEPETEEEVAPEPETDETSKEVAPEVESEEESAQASPEDESENPEEARFGFPAFAKFLIQ